MVQDGLEQGTLTQPKKKRMMEERGASAKRKKRDRGKERGEDYEGVTHRRDTTCQVAKRVMP